MKTTTKLWMGAMLSAALLAPVVGSQARDAAKTQTDVLEMKAVPDGNYLVSLQLDGRELKANLKVKDNSAKCVNSTDPRLKALEGKFELIGNGVFLISLRNEKRTATQWWLFRPDGSAIVKEVPDRGEQQRAVPVNDDTLKS